MNIDTKKGNQLYRGFSEIADSYAIDYFSEWTYNRPLIISLETNKKMQRIQKFLYKAICYFVKHYNEYSHLMPLSERAEEIISLCKDKPYTPGSYRTDFVIDENNNLKIIEITCRLALNGYFISAFFNRMAQKFIHDKPDIQHVVDNYSPFFDYFTKLAGDFDHYYLLKGPISYAESKYVIPILKKAGFDVSIINPEDISGILVFLKEGIFISEFSQQQWYNLPNDTIKRITDYKLINDPRTIFLIHDKRFFSILNNNDFLKKILNDEEATEFHSYLVPTYTPNERPDLWEDAKGNKENWIIKPFAKGKSTDVFAGCVTALEEWDNLFSSEKTSSMILQPYIRQRKFIGTIKDNNYNDYAAGILLNFNDNFFGPGVFRASSFPVTNKVDDRKIFPLVTDLVSEDISYNYI